MCTPVEFALAPAVDITIYAYVRDLSTRAMVSKNPENIIVIAISKAISLGCERATG